MSSDWKNLIERLQLIDIPQKTIRRAQEISRRAQASQILVNKISLARIPTLCLDIACALDRQQFDVELAMRYIGWTEGPYFIHRKLLSKTLQIVLPGPTIESLCTKYGSVNLIPKCKRLMDLYLDSRVQSDKLDQEELIVACFFVLCSKFNIKLQAKEQAELGYVRQPPSLSYKLARTIEEKCASYLETLDQANTRSRTPLKRTSSIILSSEQDEQPETPSKRSSRSAPGSQRKDVRQTPGSQRQDIRETPSKEDLSSRLRTTTRSTRQTPSKDLESLETSPKSTPSKALKSLTNTPSKILKSGLSTPSKILKSTVNTPSKLAQSVTRTPRRTSPRHSQEETPSKPKRTTQPQSARRTTKKQRKYHIGTNFMTLSRDSDAQLQEWMQQVLSSLVVEMVQ
ncbi:hypothetical protein EDD86DRAFT_204793 [Gorgonomyces haynaldii]|nr:hypothetical protein EDD86DRAFT_204793 [Gorgonomyces haynaldii]